MSEPAKSLKASTDTLLVLRAFAICLLVVNHATPQPFVGALNILMFASGVSFAKIGFRSTSSETLKAMYHFLFRLVVFTMIIVFAGTAYYSWSWYPNGFYPQELFMFSNWTGRHQIAPVPVWYTQFMLQAFACLALIFYAFDLTPRLRRHPIWVTGIMLAVSVLMVVVAESIWDTNASLDDRLPHLHVWNLILGWLFWAVFLNRTSNMQDRIIFSIGFCVVLGTVFLYAGLASGDLRMLVFAPAGLLLIWFPRIQLGGLLSHIVGLLNRATLSIFLLHIVFLRLGQKLPILIGIDPEGPIASTGLIVGGIVGPVLVWAFVSAVRRAYRKLVADSPWSGPILNLSSAQSAIG